LINIENTSGCQLYLSRDALHAEIVTSLTSGFNVNIPGVSAEDDMIELAVPQQFKSVIRGNKLETEVLAHVGVWEDSQEEEIKCEDSDTTSDLKKPTVAFQYGGAVCNYPIQCNEPLAFHS